MVTLLTLQYFPNIIIICIRIPMEMGVLDLFIGVPQLEYLTMIWSVSGNIYHQATLLQHQGEPLENTTVGYEPGEVRRLVSWGSSPHLPIIFTTRKPPGRAETGPSGCQCLCLPHLQLYLGWPGWGRKCRESHLGSDFLGIALFRGLDHLTLRVSI